MWDPLFDETGWNKVGTAHRTSRLISLDHLRDPECPKCGPMGAKKGPKYAENGILATQIWVWQVAQTGLSGCLHWCFNLVHLILFLVWFHQLPGIFTCSKYLPLTTTLSICYFMDRIARSVVRPSTQALSF